MSLNYTQMKAIKAARAFRHHWPKDSPMALVTSWLGVSERDAELIIMDLEEAGYDLEAMSPQEIRDHAARTFHWLDAEGALDG